MAQQRGTTSKPRSRPVSAAVLCRTRSQFDAIMAALIAADVRVEVVGLGGLLNTPEVTDVVAMVQAMHDPYRGDALIRLWPNTRVSASARKGTCRACNKIGRAQGAHR